MGGTFARSCFIACSFMIMIMISVVNASALLAVGAAANLGSANMCHARSTVETCSPVRNNICGWCGPSKGCVPLADKATCPSCHIYLNETSCQGSWTAKDSPFSYCYWSKESKSCHNHWCRSRTTPSSCSHHNSGGCGWCGDKCVSAVTLQPTCPLCSTYNTSSLCTNSVNPIKGFDSYCTWSTVTDSCVGHICRHNESPEQCRSTPNCGWCGGHCVNLGEKAQCPSCHTYNTSTLCDQSLTPTYSGSFFCSWSNATNTCHNHECRHRKTPEVCSNYLSGHCGWCGESGCVRTGKSFTCPSCSTYTNATTCNNSLMTEWTDSGYYCVWSNGECRRNG